MRYLTEESSGGGPSGLSLSGDRRVVYFSRGDGTCAGHLAKTSVSGGKEVALRGREVIGVGRPLEGSPAARPDESAIAFTRHNCETNAEELVISVLPIGGVENRFAVRAQRLVWDQEGGVLAFTEIPQEKVGKDFEWIKLWKTREDTTVVSRMGIKASHTECSLRSGDFAPDTNLLVAIERCGQPGSEATGRLIAFEVTTAALSHIVFELPKGRVFAGGISFDPTGRYLLFSETQEPEEAVIVSSERQVAPIELKILDLVEEKTSRVGLAPEVSDGIW